MKTVRVSTNYEMVTAQPGSPANGLSNVVRLSDHETAMWFDSETAETMLNASDEDFEQMCDELF